MASPDKFPREVVIREADPDDAAAVVAHMNACAAETDFLGFGGGEYTSAQDVDADYLEQQFRSPNSLFLVATVGERIVGSLSFTGGHRTRNVHTGEFGMSVHKPFWNFGIGTLLLESLIAWARSSGVVTKLDLLVRADNERAIRLYERRGFEREGRIRRAVRIEGIYHDALYMGLILDP